MSIENGLSIEDMREQGAYDGLHSEKKEFTFEDVKNEIAGVQPDQDPENPYYKPLSRLQALWEFEIEPMTDGPEKEELMTLYDQKAFDLFSAEIQVPLKHEAKNPSYRPQGRLRAVDEAIREFPFARAGLMEKLFEQADQKARELPGQSEISNEAESE